MAQLICFLIPSLLLLRIYKTTSLFQKQHLKRGVIITLTVSLGLVVGINTIVNSLKDVSPHPQSYEDAIKSGLLTLNHKYGLWIDLGKVALLPAVCEEFFFRGFILTALLQKIKPWPAILLSSLLFAIFHINPIFVAFYLVIGIGFGWIFVRYHNLGLSILAHLINNAIGVMVYHFMV